MGFDFNSPWYVLGPELAFVYAAKSVIDYWEVYLSFVAGIAVGYFWPK